ncbi:MAG: hypothetical protein HY355_07695 [Armatimonadetes bacterium]|nr:hypothetical protein [Armatimonadota bacterium]
MQQAVARGATHRRSFVQEVRRGPPVEVVTGDASERYDLVVLATGLNGYPLALYSFDYRPPPVGSMFQTELYLGHDEVQRRLGSSVHVFLPPDDVATYGILIPKGPFVTVSLLNARSQMRSLRQFLGLDEVAAVLGKRVRQVCGCLPRISVGLARNFVDDGLVAIGDTAATRLYKNGIGSALATAERAAWTAIYHGPGRYEFATSYLPLCDAIEHDNRIGRLLFLQVPLLKRAGMLPMAHCRLAADGRGRPGASELHTRLLWGMFTGAYSYQDLFHMTLNAGLLIRFMRALGSSVLHCAASRTRLSPHARRPAIGGDGVGRSDVL